MIHQRRHGFPVDGCYTCRVSSITLATANLSRDRREGITQRGLEREEIALAKEEGRELYRASEFKNQSWKDA